MLKMEIPGFGVLEIGHLVSDFTGTLSADGRLLPSVWEMLNSISQVMNIHVLTADTFGTSSKALEGVECTLNVLSGDDVDVQKEKFVLGLGVDHVAAIGNGSNDRLMLKAARLGIAVTEAEGCSTAALMNSDIHVSSITDGLGLLLNPKRLKATLRV